MKKLNETVTEDFSHPPVQISRTKVHPSDRPLIEKPSEAETIFTNELNTCRLLIVQTLMKSIANITSGTTIRAEDLDDLCRKASVLLIDFTEDSIERFQLAWHHVLAPFIAGAWENHENERLLELFNRKMEARDNALLRQEVAMQLSESILTINRLTHEIRERGRQLRGEKRQWVLDNDDEFMKLLADLRARKKQVKAGFRETRAAVYNLVLRRIALAGEVKFEGLTGMSAEMVEFDDSSLSPVQSEIQAMRVRCRRMRIIRTLSGIASLRYYTKKMESLNMDRVMERAQLWESKRDFELLHEQMVQTVVQSYHRLANAEMDLLRLTQQLENEKQSTIQLVHWKAKNLKREEQLQEDLRKVAFAGKVNVGQMLTRLESAREKLDELKGYGDEFEAEVERSVRTPMRRADVVRGQILSAQIQKGEDLRTRPQTAQPERDEGLISEITEENMQLRSRNDILEGQIEQLDDALRQMPKHTVEFVEELVPAARQAMKKPATARKAQLRQIMRPKTALAVPRGLIPELNWKTHR
jgi:hypothetical protein